MATNVITSEASRLGPFTAEALKALNGALEVRDPQEVLHWAISTFFPDIALACSFGGTSGMVLLDMVMKINPKVEVFYLDTDFLFPETYRLKEEAAERYGFIPLTFKSMLTPEEQARQYGDALWARNPDLCCQLRKVEPMGRALAGKRAWIAGLRRDQATTRRNIRILEWDTQFHLIKVNPLANWTERDVWRYIVENNVPYNPLHDRGYPSIGCTHCTKPVAAGADPRSGRWQGFEKIECGIHQQPPRAG